MSRSSLRMAPIFPVLISWNGGSCLLVWSNSACPNQKALIFIRKRWKDIVSYIGNKNTHIHQEASDFIIRYYAETGLDVPTKVHFRDVIWTINDYFNDLDDQDAVWAKHYKLGMARVWTRVG